MPQPKYAFRHNLRCGRLVVTQGLFWAVSFVPVTAIGAFEAWRQGVNLRGAEGP